MRLTRVMVLSIMTMVGVQGAMAAVTVTKASFGKLTDGTAVDVYTIKDADLERAIVGNLKKKSGLHQPFVAALPEGAIPPLAARVLDALTQPAAGQPALIELPGL